MKRSRQRLRKGPERNSILTKAIQICRSRRSSLLNPSSSAMLVLKEHPCFTGQRLYLTVHTPTRSRFSEPNFRSRSIIDVRHKSTKFLCTVYLSFPNSPSAQTCITIPITPSTLSSLTFLTKLKYRPILQKQSQTKQFRLCKGTSPTITRRRRMLSSSFATKARPPTAKGHFIKTAPLEILPGLFK